jgi:hypothetical protein
MVLDSAHADKHLGGDLGVGGLPASQVLRPTFLAALGDYRSQGSSSVCAPRGGQFGPCPLREADAAKLREEPVGGAQLLPSIRRAALVGQPLIVDKVGAGKVQAQRRRREPIVAGFSDPAECDRGAQGSVRIQISSPRTGVSLSRGTGDIARSGQGQNG